MEFLPSALAAASVLDCCPLAFADDGQSNAVDDEMDGSAGSDSI